jgi:hypothetical protein
MYKKRKETKNEFNNIFYKLLMNSLYGKYATQYRKVQYFEGEELKNLDPQVLEENIIMKIDDNYYSITDAINQKLLAKNDIVHLASNVTSFARMKMYSMLEKYENSVLYCDTDSLFSSRSIDEKDISQTELGKFKFCGEFESGYILNPKHYILRAHDTTKVKIKGVQRAEDIYFSDKFLFDLLGVNKPIETEFSQDKLTSLRESYHLKNYDYMDLRRFKKKLSFCDNSKRVFNNSLDFNYQYSLSESIVL